MLPKIIFMDNIYIFYKIKLTQKTNLLRILRSRKVIYIINFLESNSNE